MRLACLQIRIYLLCFPDPRLDRTILVPLTNSLYVPGKLADLEHVIVDVGTGYYVKKVCWHLLGLVWYLTLSREPEPPRCSEALQREDRLCQKQLGYAPGDVIAETR